MEIIHHPLHLPARDFRALFVLFGPSLGLWRAAEIAVMRAYCASETGLQPPVLDLGCGDGQVTSFILPQVDIGLDPDGNALRRAADLGLYSRFETSAIETSTIQPGSLGTVISNSVLEHVESIDGALAAVARALRPGGQLVFTGPTEAFSRWLALPARRYAARRNRHFIHLNLFSLEEWSRRLERAGLEVVQVRPYMRRGWVRAWDMLELSESVWLGRTRLVGAAWKRLPPAWMDRIARRAGQLDLSAPSPGGGRLIVALKR